MVSIPRDHGIYVRSHMTDCERLSGCGYFADIGANLCRFSLGPTLVILAVPPRSVPRSVRPLGPLRSRRW